MAGQGPQGMDLATKEKAFLLPGQRADLLGKQDHPSLEDIQQVWTVHMNISGPQSQSFTADDYLCNMVKKIYNVWKGTAEGSAESVNTSTFNTRLDLDNVSNYQPIQNIIFLSKVIQRLAADL